MANILEIKDGKKLVALIFKHALRAEGVKFLTPNNYTLQLGLLEHPRGKEVRPHRHPNLKYNVNTTQEFIYVEKGSIQAIFFNNNWSVLKKIKLNKGDFMLCISGGHAFKMLAATRLIEVKQGPYPGDKKAKIFKPEK